MTTRTNGFSTCLGCNSEDTIWTWLFVLRCEDATGSIDVICTQNEAVCDILPPIFRTNRICVDELPWWNSTLRPTSKYHCL